MNLIASMLSIDNAYQKESLGITILPHLQRCIWRYMQYMRNACRQCLFEIAAQTPVPRKNCCTEEPGATLITSGSLLSQTIPASSNLWATLWSKPGLSRRLNWAPRAWGSEGVMMRKCHDSSVVPREKSANFPHCLQAPLWARACLRTQTEVPHSRKIIVR